MFNNLKKIYFIITLSYQPLNYSYTLVYHDTLVKKKNKQTNLGILILILALRIFTV